jgi:hypothetical protein
VLEALRRTGAVDGPPFQPIAAVDWIHLWLERRHSTHDLRRAPLLLVEGQRYVEDAYARAPTEFRLRVRAGALSRCRADTVFCHYPGVVISDRVRAALELERPVEAEFRDIEPIVSYREPVVLPWREVSPPWWELRSAVRLPPVSPSMQRLDENGSPFIDYSTQHLRLSDGPYSDVVFRYRGSDLEPLLPFDLAMTNEHIPEPPCGERLIVSQRVYQLFQKHKIKARWTPVVVEDS